MQRNGLMIKKYIVFFFIFTTSIRNKITNSVKRYHIMQKQADHNGSLAQEFDKEQLKKRLTPVQYRVTQDKITERYV